MLTLFLSQRMHERHKFQLPVIPHVSGQARFLFAAQSYFSSYRHTIYHSLDRLVQAFSMHLHSYQESLYPISYTLCSVHRVGYV